MPKPPIVYDVFGDRFWPHGVEIIMLMDKVSSIWQDCKHVYFVDAQKYLPKQEKTDA